MEVTMKIELPVGLPTSKASSYKSSCSLGVAIHERYQLPDGTYRFVTELSDAVLLLKKEGTGLERYMPESELAEMLGKGTATRLREPRNKDGKPIKLVSGDELAPDELRTKRGIRAQALWEGVREFDSDPKATKGAKGLRTHPDQASREGDRVPNLTHPSAVGYQQLRLPWRPTPALLPLPPGQNQTLTPPREGRGLPGGDRKLFLGQAYSRLQRRHSLFRGPLQRGE
jgi:hypothetical protein